MAPSVMQREGVDAGLTHAAPLKAATSTAPKQVPLVKAASQSSALEMALGRLEAGEGLDDVRATTPASMEVARAAEERACMGPVPGAGAGEGASVHGGGDDVVAHGRRTGSARGRRAPPDGGEAGEMGGRPRSGTGVDGVEEKEERGEEDGGEEETGTGGERGGGRRGGSDRGEVMGRQRTERGVLGVVGIARARNVAKRRGLNGRLGGGAAERRDAAKGLGSEREGGSTGTEEGGGSGDVERKAVETASSEREEEEKADRGQKGRRMEQVVAATMAQERPRIKYDISEVVQASGRAD